MVWFQCEDCGENLKKPKLANHFRMCSAFKLSCIDCGKMFDQQSVQAHTQCISEAEKYGPKDLAKSPHSAQQTPNKSKPNADIDVNVGLSSRPPWKCSLCNTTTTSMQTLLGHADGKKHRAKARAFHASQNKSSPTEGATPNNQPNVEEPSKVELDGGVLETKNDSAATVSDVEVENGERKRKLTAATGNGEVIQADEKAQPESQRILKKKKKTQVEPKKKIKWKKIAASILKESPNGVLKTKKLQKLVLKEIEQGSGMDEDMTRLHDKLMDKIASSSRFAIESKCVRLVSKLGSSS